MYSGRSILETHLRCAECGSDLGLSYEKDARLTNQKSTRATDTTGALKVEISVFVEPCKICMRPAERIMEAMKILEKQGKS